MSADWQDELLSYGTARELRREIVAIAKATYDLPESRVSSDSPLTVFLMMGGAYGYALADLLAWLGTQDERIAQDAANRVSFGIVNGYDDDLNADVWPKDGAA